jgi:hypothetical protein
VCLDSSSYYSFGKRCVSLCVLCYRHLLLTFPLATKKEGRTRAQQLQDLEESLAEISLTVRTIRNESLSSSPVRLDDVQTREATRSPTGSTKSNTGSVGSSKEDAALAKLEYVRTTQMNAQQWRTENRIRALALESSSRKSPKKSQDGLGEEDSSEDDDLGATRHLRNPESPGAQNKEGQAPHREVSLPNTDQRRNVTKRRLTDRARDSLGSVYYRRDHRQGKGMPIMSMRILEHQDVQELNQSCLPQGK